MTIFNVRTVKLQPGEQFRDTKEVELEPLELGGQRYVPIPETPEATLTFNRLTSGLMLELELGVRLVGPCVRCLTDAGVSLDVRAREYQATSPGEAEELTSPYLVDDRLDLSAWARDAVALDLPDKILCRADCAGLCPECGRDLNIEPHEHEQQATDPRWGALAKLRDRL
ncbi:MAG: DUF177 domain-containing protein [Gaiellales bacterium]